MIRKFEAQNLKFGDSGFPISSFQFQMSIKLAAIAATVSKRKPD